MYTTSIVLGTPLTHHFLCALLPAGDVAHQRLPQQPCEGEMGQEPVHRGHRIRPHCQLSGPACAIAQRCQHHQQPQGASATTSAAAAGGVTSGGSRHQQRHVQYLSGARAAVAAAAGQSCCFAYACQLPVAILFGGRTVVGMDRQQNYCCVQRWAGCLWQTDLMRCVGGC